MSNVNDLLSQRLKKNEQSSKMAAMAKQSANGKLTSFSGIFPLSTLSESEKEYLHEILKEYTTEGADLKQDLNALVSITSEVKAINNQAAILHGERIKKARSILIRYRDGAFSAWLIAAYGNRQTPYNFLQYFEFYESLPKILRQRIEEMPRQAIYTLASREGPFEKKQLIIQDYKGETKNELLIKIREAFPLEAHDKRKEDNGEAAIKTLEKLCTSFKRPQVSLSKAQKSFLFQLIDDLRDLVKKSKSKEH